MNSPTIFSIRFHSPAGSDALAFRSNSTFVD